MTTEEKKMFKELVTIVELLIDYGPANAPEIHSRINDLQRKIEQDERKMVK